MNLGENIYRLRTEKNLSQGELADALDVSRQSVSKWENNSAVPELDKLMKMAGIFEISLDALVANSSDQKQSTPPAEPSFSKLPPEPQKTSGVIPGFILLFIALALCVLITLQSTFLAGVLYAGPLFVCSALCFILERRRGLWCCWILLFSAVTWIYRGTGIGLHAFWTWFATIWEFPTGLYRILMALAINTAVTITGSWTLRSYKTAAIRYTTVKKPHLFLGWLLTFVPQILENALSAFLFHSSVQGQLSPLYHLLRWLSYSMNWLHLIAILIMLIFTIARFRQLQMRASSD